MSEDLVKSLKKQVSALEKVQDDAIKKGDMQKVQETANSIISIVNTISSMKQG